MVRETLPATSLREKLYAVGRVWDKNNNNQLALTPHLNGAPSHSTSAKGLRKYMSRNIGVCLLALVSGCAIPVLASAQATSSPSEVSNSNPASSSPVAYVYVPSSPSSGNVQIDRKSVV